MWSRAPPTAVPAVALEGRLGAAEPRCYPRRMHKTSLFALALGCGLSASPPAWAGLALGVDVGPNFVLNAPDSGAQGFDIDKSAGIGVSVRAGFLLDAKLIKLTPEAKLGFEDPGAPNAFRIMGGLRINLLEGFSPVAFAHLGGMVGDLEGFCWDVGGGLDFTLIPKLNLGAYVSYNRAENRPFDLAEEFIGSDAWEWIQIGGAATIMF